MTSPAPRLPSPWLLRLALTLLLALGSAVPAGAAEPGSAPTSAAAAAPAAPTLADAAAPVPVPPLQGRVNDRIGMLAPAQRAALETVLADYERRTGSQIAILLVASTAPDPIEHFSIRVAEAWQLGRKGIDDGVLLVVARDNPKDLRRLRIEAGRGVQGTLTDAQSKRILQDTIAPHFRQNDYYGGLAAGVAAITALLDQEHFAAPVRQSAKASATVTAGQSWPFLLVAVIVMAILLRSRWSGAPRLRHGSSGWDGGTGVALGAILGNELARRQHGGLGGGFGGGIGGGDSFGGGGTFDGGGASGDW